jgi:ATP-binding cassette subfamily B protein
LVWTTSALLSTAIVVLIVLVAVLPAAFAYVGSLLVDSVINAPPVPGPQRALSTVAFRYVAIEAGLAILSSLSQRSLLLCQSLLAAQLGKRIKILVFEKTSTIEFSQFEDAALYDKLERARREALNRPLGFIIRACSLIQNVLYLVTFGCLLAKLSPWAVVLLLTSGLPAFASEAKFSGENYRLTKARESKLRMQDYLESLLAREDTGKEIRLFRLGPLLLKRYREGWAWMHAQDMRLVVHREAWGFGLGVVGVGMLYSGYAWAVIQATVGLLSLGQMTMYIALFRQGKDAVNVALRAISGLYEDNLYLSNLFEFLAHPVTAKTGSSTFGPRPGDGIRFEEVEFVYPGSPKPAVSGISFHVRPGTTLALVGQNGSGKTTLIKLLTRLYRPSSGRIMLDGLDLQEWDERTLHERLGVLFQDFARYQMLAGENIGVGKVEGFEDEERWKRAATRSLAHPFVAELSLGYHNRLGKWFTNGYEPSGGQWQTIALARVFMRHTADVLVLDEPTSAMDAGTEAELFRNLNEFALAKTAIIISHRLSTIRFANHIIVLHRGRILERGDHASLIALQGRYASIFALQASGYQ